MMCQNWHRTSTGSDQSEIDVNWRFESSMFWGWHEARLGSSTRALPDPLRSLRPRMHEIRHV
jgi:hypothetical protein